MRLELGNRIWDDGTQVGRKILKEEWSVWYKLRWAQKRKGFNLRMCHIIEGLLHWNWNLTTLILFCLNSIPRFASHTSCTPAAIKCFQEAISFDPLRDLERCDSKATKETLFSAAQDELYPSLLSERADCAFILRYSWCLSPGRKETGWLLSQIWLFSPSEFMLTHVLKYSA